MPEIEISEKLTVFLIFLPLFFLSIAFHEFAHAIMAYKKGDPTAKDEGRLTLNPLKHIDLFGSLVMPLISFSSGLALIGWAKPVPVNRNYFRDPIKDDIVVTFAGPFSNLILCFVFAMVFSFAYNQPSLSQNTILIRILFLAIYLNAFLFLFNLLPIPPLDGAHLLYDFFPGEFTARYLNLGLYGSIILLLFIYSPLWRYFSYALNFIIQSFLSLTGAKL